MLSRGFPLRLLSPALVVIGALPAVSCSNSTVDELLAEPDAEAVDVARLAEPDAEAVDVARLAEPDPHDGPSPRDEVDSDGVEEPATPGRPSALSAGEGRTLVLAAVDAAETSFEAVRMHMEMTVRGLPDLPADEVSFSMDAAVADGGDSVEISMDLSRIAAGFDPDGDADQAFFATAFAEPIEIEMMITDHGPGVVIEAPPADEVTIFDGVPASGG